MILAFAVFLTLCEAFFTALEVAMNAVSRARMRSLIENEKEARDENARSDESGQAAHADTSSKNVRGKTELRAARTLRLLEQPERLTLFFISFTSLSLWATASLLTWQSIGSDWPLATLAASFVCVLFFAEVVPLLIAARNPEGVALMASGVVRGAMKLFSPLLWLLGTSGKALARLLGAGEGATTQVTQGELRTALAAAEEEGVIESEERAMLEGAISFREKRVYQVMTPRIDIVGVAASAPLAEVLQISMREGHSRLPVFDGSLDNIVGILSTKDLLPHLRAARESHSEICARDVAREAYFVPLQKRIAPTLEDLRCQRSLIAIAIDENGGTAGLVTLEDLLEEIVGEIQDEYDDEEPPLRVVESTPENRRTFAIACDAAVSVGEARAFWRKSFGMNLSLNDAAGNVSKTEISLAALALNLFDGVPRQGDRVRAGTIAHSDPKNSDAKSVDAKSADAKSAEMADNIVWLGIEAMSGPRIETLGLQANAPQASDSTTEVSDSAPAGTDGQQ